MKRALLLLGALIMLAVVFSVGFAAGLLYHSHRGTREWDDRALTATFRSAVLEGDRGKESPIFFYVVENHTSDDYSIENATQVQMLVREEGALDSSWLQGVALDVPIFIPSREKVSIGVHFRMIESEQPKSQAQPDVQAFIRDPHRTWHSFNNFVLLDRRHRYRINFPMPWH